MMNLNHSVFSAVLALSVLFTSSLAAAKPGQREILIEATDAYAGTAFAKLILDQSSNEVTIQKCWHRGCRDQGKMERGEFLMNVQKLANNLNGVYLLQDTAVGLIRSGSEAGVLAAVGLIAGNIIGMPIIGAVALPVAVSGVSVCLDIPDRQRCVTQLRNIETELNSESNVPYVIKIESSQTYDDVLRRLISWSH